MKQILKQISYAFTDRWAPASRLMLMTDIDSWVISWEMRELEKTARRLGLSLLDSKWRGFCRNQALFYGSQFFMLNDDWLGLEHRVGTAYFHGKPGTGFPEFDQLYERLRRHHDRLARIQVSHSEMETIILESGIDPSKVFRIPIGVNLDFFPLRTDAARRQARLDLNIPESAIVIGSFQKDGMGWGDGMEPKPIKGPDLFLKVIQGLRDRIPELMVLLSGPARGYIKKGLHEIGVPFRHEHLDYYPDIRRLYHALDLYLVTSRQEGGPKAILESMACGIPLVTTRMGQAMDLVKHGENAYMADVDDADGLLHWAAEALSAPSGLSGIIQKGRETAEVNSYSAQKPLWKDFFEGFAGDK
jgi:glycosyltransferase involved in cell wall biosynthesis